MSEWRDRLDRGLAGGDTVRYLAVDATSAADEARRAHGLGAGAARLGAQGVVAGVLMSAYVKGEERLTLQLQASEPAGAFVVEVDSEGHVRARVSPADLAWPADGRLDGILLAIKADARRELYRGATRIARQTMEQALAEHLSTSSQVDALLRIGVEIDDAGVVRRAVGVLVERLPFEAGHPSITPAEFLEAWGPLRDVDAIDLHDEALAAELLGRPLRPLVERPIRWQCRCSREKVESTLVALGVAELTAMRDEDGQAEVICHFCNTARVIDRDGLDALIGRAVGHAAS